MTGALWNRPASWWNRRGIRYPELAASEKDWLDRQLVNINHQQADGDFNQAEFYRRTGKYGSAYFYYELVRRRYPGTNYAKLSVPAAWMRFVPWRKRTKADAKQGGRGLARNRPHSVQRNGLLNRLLPAEASLQSRIAGPSPHSPIPWCAGRDDPGRSRR